MLTRVFVPATFSGMLAEHNALSTFEVFAGKFEISLTNAEGYQRP